MGMKKYEYFHMAAWKKIRGAKRRTKEFFTN
jgi:hypothetical protein